MNLNVYSLPLANFDPLKAYQRICPAGPGFLESPVSSPTTGRYTILPLRCCESYRLQRGQLWRSDSREEDLLTGDPLQRLAAILRQRWIPESPASPFPGGFFGFFGYDLASYIEDLPHRARRDLSIPKLQLAWVDTTAVYNHRTRHLCLASLDPQLDLQPLAEVIVESQNQPLSTGPVQVDPVQPLLSEEEFVSMVHRGQQYIAAGDIYQVNLSCRYDSRIRGDSVELYRRLRQLNPSPFACLLRFSSLEIISSSPERLVSLRSGHAETRPIAGTRPRGSSLSEDRRLAAELLAHSKERAEHIMLVDLERNDLGKVCVSGSVRVEELMVLERYSHVNHIVSNVSGRIDPAAGPFDLLRAMFPGGTITGVPKKRCMEIIDELEPVGRGSYTGSAGYISACGNMDLNILIRGFQRLGNHLSYQAGAGIVADSIPEREWRECLAKGAALNRILAETEG